MLNERCSQLLPYQDNGVPGGDGDDVGAGDDVRALVLDRGLDLVDDLEPAERVPVGVGPLLRDEPAAASASSSTEASHPCTKQSWKCIRSRDAAMRGSSACAFATMAPTMACICGHVCS